MIKILGKEVVGKEFVDREKEIEKIRKLIQKNNIAVYGPRRIGKTSLMLEFARRTNDKYGYMHLDVHRVVPLNHKNFIKNIGSTFINIYSNITGEKIIPFMHRIKRELPELFSRTQIKILKDWVELGTTPNPDISDFMKKTFTLGEKLAEKAQKDFLILLDEIPGIVRMTKGQPDHRDLDFLWALRSYLNEAKHVHYIISGSEVGMMEHLCGSKESPFYGSFIPIKIGGLERKASIIFLKKYVPKKYAAVITEETHCFPLYLQAYAIASRLGAKTIDSIRISAFDLLFLHFKDLENHLSPQQRVILKNMATENIAETRKIAKKTQLPYSTVHLHLTRMTNTGFIIKVKEGEYKFIDPIFKKWLATK